MPVSMHIEVESFFEILSDENPCFLDPILEFVPCVFSEWITLSGFHDLTVWVKLSTV